MTTGDRERYARLRELFDQAADLDGEALRAFLDRNCADIELRGELERLLRADRSAGDAFGADAPPRADTEPPALARPLPERIGRYRILHRLGEGGMGSVFAAEQDHPRRTVALKLMHVGLLTPAMQRRFEYEGEVLARLAHPCIAHVYEAGTAEVGGVTLPFFAMELVNGVPITRFAEHHRLGLRERLELVARVADAVDHAHHMGVIHRDLKPQNILVGENGQPKILDFGIARATQDEERSDTLRTRSGMLVGTLAYMSPEQASGDPRALDTRSDVYALGVLAYELLTGRLPLDLSNVSIASAARMIGEAEPERPGTIDSRLRGDVETILLKALEKDKQRRYASAAALAVDVRAFLGHQPIAARPATTLYQVRKFARRNPGLVAGLAATFVALAIGLVVSLEYYRKSERARVAAEQSAQAEARARKRSDSIKDYLLKEMFAAPDPWSPQGKDVTVAAMLDRISDRVSKSLADDPELEADAQATLGDSYLARGMADRAALHADRALELRRRLHAGDDLDLADSLLLGARVRLERGELDAAGSAALEAVGMYERLADAPRERLADARRELARVHLAKGEHAEALQGFQAVLDVRRDLYGPVHELVAQALADLLAAHTAMGHTDEAVRLGRETLALRRALHGADSPHVALSMVDLAAVLFEQRTPEADAESIDLQRKAVAIDEKQLGPEHRLTLLARRNLANSLVRVDQKEEAEQILRTVTEALPRVIGEEHEDFVQTLNSYGYLLFTMDRTDEAETQYRKAVEISEKVFGPTHDNTLRPLANLGYLEKDRGFSNARDQDGDGFPDVEPDSDLDRSIAHLRSALKGFEGLYGPDHEHTSSLVYALADTFNRLGRFAEAAPLFHRHALDLERNQPPEYEQTITRVLMLEGSARVKSGVPTEGEAPLRESVRRCRAVFPADDWRTALCESALGDCLTKIGKAEEAETVLLESLRALEPLRAQRKRDLALVLGRLAAACEAQGKAAEARSYRERL